MRINKFNSGLNPIEELNNRINILINGVTDRNVLVSRIQETANGLSNGDMKKCPRCGEVKKLEDFKDSNLISGIGRICIDCKHIHRNQSEVNDNSVEVDENTRCPRCDSSMILRNGKYGRFYGCSDYPRCRGTRRV